MLPESCCLNKEIAHLQDRATCETYGPIRLPKSGSFPMLIP